MSAAFSHCPLGTGYFALLQRTDNGCRKLQKIFGSRLAAATSKTKMRTVSVGVLPLLSADVGENIKISVGIA